MVQAYEWFSIASQRADEESKSKATAALSGMQSRLSTEQKTAAHKAAQEWLDKHTRAYPGQYRNN